MTLTNCRRSIAATVVATLLLLTPGYNGLAAAAGIIGGESARPSGVGVPALATTPAAALNPTAVQASIGSLRGLITVANDTSTPLPDRLSAVAQIATTPGEPAQAALIAVAAAARAAGDAAEGGVGRAAVAAFLDNPTRRLDPEQAAWWLEIISRMPAEQAASIFDAAAAHAVAGTTPTAEEIAAVAAVAGNSSAPTLPLPTSPAAPAARQAPPVPAETAGKPDAEGGFTPTEINRAVWGLTANRFFSLISLSMSSIAYPMMVIGAVGSADFLALGTWASLANIPLSILAGKVGDMAPLKKYTVFNVVLRGAISLITAAMIAGGALSYGPLLLMTILSAWQFASLFNVEPAVQTEVNGTNVGRNRSTEALIRMTTIIVSVLSGLFLGAAAIKTLGYFWTFMMIGGIQLIPSFILWKTLPNGGRMSRSKMPTWAQIKEAFLGFPRRFLEKIRGLFGAGSAAGSILTKTKVLVTSPALRKTLLNGALIAVALGAFLIPIPGAAFLLHSPVPFVIVSAYLVWRSETYQTLIKPAVLLRTSLLFVIIGAFIETPLRNSVLGVLANETDPKTAAAYLGTLLAAFYLGQAPSGTGMLDPKMTVRVFGRELPFRETMKWVGALGTAAWVSYILLPSMALSAGAPLWLGTASVAGLIAATVVAGYVALHNLTPQVSDLAWMRIEAGALLFVGLVPAFFGLAPWSLFLSLAVFGFVLNGSQRMLSATFNVEAKKAAPDKYQRLSAIRGSFFNVATSVALAIYTVAKTLPARWGDSHAFPFTWYVIGALYAGFAVMFWRGSSIFRTARQDDAAKKSDPKKS